MKTWRQRQRTSSLLRLLGSFCHMYRSCKPSPPPPPQASPCVRMLCLLFPWHHLCLMKPGGGGLNFDPWQAAIEKWTDTSLCPVLQIMLSGLFSTCSMGTRLPAKNKDSLVFSIISSAVNRPIYQPEIQMQYLDHFLYYVIFLYHFTISTCWVRGGDKINSA